MRAAGKNHHPVSFPMRISRSKQTGFTARSRAGDIQAAAARNTKRAPMIARLVAPHNRRARWNNRCSERDFALRLGCAHARPVREGARRAFVE